MNRFTAEEKARAAERELAYRRHVFPRRVITNKMTYAAAEYQIAIFAEIAQDYREQAKKERLL